MVRVWSDVPPKQDQSARSSRHRSDRQAQRSTHLDSISPVLDRIAGMTFTASLCGLALLVIYLVVAAYLTWG